MPGVAEAEVACAAADIILTATLARAPLFEADWVGPGITSPEWAPMRTASRNCCRPCSGVRTLFCDSPEQARRIGELQHAPSDAAVTVLGEVLLGRHSGRRSDEEITIFYSSGLSVQDF